MKIQIKINNWSKYNPRSDIKASSWFRLEHKLLDDPDFYDFTHEEFKAWIYLLAQSCKKNSDTIFINYEHALVVSKITKNALNSAIEKLQSLQIIDITRNVDVTRTLRARNAHDTSTNATNERTNERNDIDQQVDRLYQELYPRKIGKSKGIKKLTKEISSEKDLTDLELALKNYSEHVSGTDPKFIKHFSTWVGEWRDWIDFKNQTKQIGPRFVEPLE